VFLNYMKINLIRLFKGRGIKLAMAIQLLAVSLYFIMIICGFLFGGFLDEVQSDIQIESDSTGGNFALQAVVMGLSFTFLTPIIIGILGGSYICEYYKYKSYRNLEVGMRSKFLFCLSEFFSLIIFDIVLITETMIVISIFGVISSSMGIDDGIMAIEFPLMFLLFFVCVFLAEILDCATTLFCAKLLRRTGRAFILFFFGTIIRYIASGVLSGMGYKLVSLLLTPTCFSLLGGDTPVLMESKLDSALLVTGIAIQSIILVIFSFILFNREKEGKEK